MSGSVGGEGGVREGGRVCGNENKRNREVKKRCESKGYYCCHFNMSILRLEELRVGRKSVGVRQGESRQ